MSFSIWAWNLILPTPVQEYPQIVLTISNGFKYKNLIILTIIQSQILIMLIIQSQKGVEDEKHFNKSHNKNLDTTLHWWWQKKKNGENEFVRDF